MSLTDFLALLLVLLKRHCARAGHVRHLDRLCKGTCVLLIAILKRIQCKAKGRWCGEGHTCLDPLATLTIPILRSSMAAVQGHSQSFAGSANEEAVGTPDESC
mgnify:FL=1